MTKYKLIKKYPGSPKLGSVINNENCFVDAIKPEKYPEHWEEVKEPEYQILSFKQNTDIKDLWLEIPTRLGFWARYSNGAFVTTPYTMIGILNNNLYSIHSVKRMSDGEVFTVGDKLKYNGNTPNPVYKEIKNFFIKEEKLLFNWVGDAYQSGFNFDLLNRYDHIKEKDYEILSLILRADKVCTYEEGMKGVYTNGSLEAIYNSKEQWVKCFIESGVWKINSVKRLYDNEVFSLGDKLNQPDFVCDNSCITEILLGKNKAIVLSDGGIHADFKLAEAVKYKKVIVVNKKEYKIIAYRSTVTNTIYTRNVSGYFVDRLENSLSKPIEEHVNMEIYAVERLSDGEVFSIGDKFKSLTGSKEIEEIQSFEIVDGFVRARMHHTQTKGSAIRLIFEDPYIERCKTPLFTTEDGVDIFEGNLFTFITGDFGTCTQKAISLDADNPKTHSFSTKEAAEEYILMNKPCLSIRDLKNNFTLAASNHARDSNWFNNIPLDKLKELVKTKINM